MRPFKNKKLRHLPDFHERTSGGLAPIIQEGFIGTVDVIKPAIPSLKKKEKERKGAALPWYGGSGVSGARVAGSGAALARAGTSALHVSPGFLGSGRIAWYLANLLGRSTVMGFFLAQRLAGLQRLQDYYFGALC